MKLSDYHSSGKEPYVFRADGPEGLIGVHAELIASAVEPGEKIYYLLYAPIRKAGNAPFDIQAEPGSHAVAVTDHRFLISKDFHDEEAPPSIRSIPFDRILRIEVGSALLLGWFVVTFEDDGVLSKSSLFYTSTGSHHFEAAVREYRRLTGKTPAFSNETAIGWHAVWRLTPHSQIDFLKSLITDEERPVNILRFRETWMKVKKSDKKICLTTEGVILATDRRGCLHVTEEKPISPGILAYGINAFCFPIDIVRSALIVKGEKDNLAPGILRIELERTSVLVNHDLPLAQESFESAKEWLEHLRQLTGR